MSKPNVKSAVAQAEADLALANAMADKQKRIDDLRSNSLPAIKVMGAEAAKGEGGLTRMAKEFARLCAQGAFMAENADVVYLTFVEGWNEEATRVAAGIDPMSSDKADKSFKNQVRVLSDFARPAVLTLCSDPSDPDAWYGDLLWDAAIAARNSTAPDDRFGSAYNTMARVARKLDERWDADKAEAHEAADGKPHAVPAPRGAEEDDLKAWVQKDVKPGKGLEAKLDAWLDTGKRLIGKQLPDGDKFAKRLAKALGDLSVLIDERNLAVRKAEALKANAEAEEERKAA